MCIFSFVGSLAGGRKKRGVVGRFGCIAATVVLPLALVVRTGVEGKEICMNPAAKRYLKSDRSGDPPDDGKALMAWLMEMWDLYIFFSLCFRGLPPRVRFAGVYKDDCY